MVHRWSLWTASGKDYDGNVIDEDAYIKPLARVLSRWQPQEPAWGAAGEREKAEHQSVGAYLVELEPPGEGVGHSTVSTSSEGD